MRHKRANKKKSTNKEILLQRLQTGEPLYSETDSLGFRLYMLGDEAWDLQSQHIVDNAETEIQGLLEVGALRQKRDFFKYLMFGENNEQIR
jgi:hypothetical protein